MVMTRTTSLPVLPNTWERNELYGLNGDDTLYSGAGNDRLEGGSGSDAMYGGAGNDTYQVDNAGDTVNEGAIRGWTSSSRPPPTLSRKTSRI